MTYYTQRLKEMKVVTGLGSLANAMEEYYLIN